MATAPGKFGKLATLQWITPHNQQVVIKELL